MTPDANLAKPVVEYVSRGLWQEYHDCKGTHLRSLVRASWERCLLGRLALTSMHAVQAAPTIVEPYLAHASTAQYASNPVPARRCQGKEHPTRRLFKLYPALARLWMIQVQNWRQFVQSFGQHAAEFAEEGNGPFSDSGIDSIAPDLSDLHHANRTVVKVKTANGIWFYKPRAGWSELAWFNLLKKLNGRGFPLPFKTLVVISRKDHCWMEAAYHRPCRSRREVTQYYFRAGALLCLAHQMRGIDFHAGNIIANGSQPMLVDCDTLLHPVSPMTERFKGPTGGILRTGMLPISGEEYDLSAFGCPMLGPHTVRLPQRTIKPSEFVQWIEKGFRCMHEVLNGRAGGMTHLEECVAVLQRKKVRYIIRPSMKYWNILQESLTPTLLTDGLKRTCFLYGSCQDGSVNHQTVRREVAALEEADIPIFYRKPTAPRPAPSRGRVDQLMLLVNSAFQGATSSREA